ncbi:hypothetical protein JAAARDRAFT_57075 [Jaapia argillacea MUCL 33604]|uniref:Uncharacterized protein n=1 Tax=Jaapia argillacea MUCL 33604 TaxID=933084 RepID=A0A067Q6K4_9AGAM|nr:hypothetical protein JAAARDRAFT_57075 [Jaapia argillacea MUCL 33604]
MRALHDELAYERKTNAWLRDQKAGLESQWYQYVSAAEHDKRIRMKEAEDHQETKRLLEARTAEWRVAQEFLTTTDHLSASQISQEVADLNNEIFQTAALLVDRLECPQQQGIPPSGITDSKGAVESRFGSFLVQRLESADISDTTLIEGAYQAVMAEQARWIVETWYRDMTAQGQAIDLRWKELYRSIHRHEPQAIAGRWRSMTNRYIWGRYTELNDPRPFVSKLADHLAHVAFIAGRTDNWGQTRKIIREEFDSSLKDIVDFAFRLHRMVKQETTSCEMRIVYTKPDSEFDPVTMEDILHENPTPWNQRVSCTAALGLKRQVGGDAGKGAGRSETVLMKAKVLLQTSTEADDKMVTS